MNLGTDGGDPVMPVGRRRAIAMQDLKPLSMLEAVPSRPDLGDGTQRDRAARSCQDLLAAHPDESDDFWIDPDGEDGPQNRSKPTAVWSMMSAAGHALRGSCTAMRSGMHGMIA